MAPQPTCAARVVQTATPSSALHPVFVSASLLRVCGGRHCSSSPGTPLCHPVQRQGLHGDRLAVSAPAQGSPLQKEVLL